MYILSCIRLLTCMHIPPELAIGDGTDASLALHLNSFLDGLILHGAQLVLRALLRIKVGTLLEKRLGPLERADVVGTERGVQARSSRHRRRGAEGFQRDRDRRAFI
jgi:hypothetical protein